MKAQIKVCKIHEDATIPSFKKYGDAGMDLTSVEEKTIEAHSFCTIKTGLKFEIPNGYEIQIRSRSGLASKYGVAVLNSPGTIDSGYRGEINVIMFNVNNKPFKVEKGMRICQMVVSKLAEFDMKEVEIIEEDTERGSHGFGSTGLKN